jgi:DNA-binding response OmpR family regulator
MKASRMSGAPNFAFAPVPSTSTKSAPPLAGSAGCFAILDPSMPPWPERSSFTNVKETTLRFLFDRQGQISTRKQLIEAVWSDPYAVGNRTVDVHIGRLRKAFAGHRKLRIRMVYGAGYALETTIVLPMS